MLRRVKKIAKVVGIIILVMVVLSVAATRLVQRPDVQRYLAKKATEWLSQKLHTQVSISHVDFEFFKRLVLKDVYIADQKNDTLFYAGSLKADISVFSIVKRKVQFKLASASNVVVNLTRHRGDKNYNLQFIVDALSDTTKSTGNKFDIQLTSADFHNVRLHWLDEPNNTDMGIKVLNTSMDINKVDFNKSLFDIKSMSIDSPVVIYKILVSPPVKHNAAPLVHALDTSRIFLPRLHAKVDNIKMKGGRFYLDDLSQIPTTKGFDPFHIHVANITFNLQGVRVQPDSIVANFKQFTAYETHGFTVKQLTGRASITAFKTEMSQLYVLTDHSELRNYFAMQYRSFYDYIDYINSMYMKGHISGSKVSFKDIAFFAPVLDYMKEDVYIDGDITGTVNRLFATHVKLKAGHNTTFEGDININGLPNIEETFFDADAAKFTTNEEDAKLFYPNLKLPDNLKGFGNVKYVGTFSGFYNDFNTKGNITTDHGSAFADVVIKLDPVDKIPGYSAVVSTNGLDLGKLLGNSNLGNMDLNGEISGSGFSSSNDSTVFHGILKSLVFNNYTYKNIALDGRLRKKLFEGQAGITDDNITLFFNGVINFSKENPIYKFTASVSNANLQKLSFYKEALVFSGDVDVDGTGSNLDDVQGTVKFKNVVLTHPGKKLAISTLSLMSSNIDGKRLYTIMAPKMLQANISGHFEPTSIPAALAHIINKSIPALKLTEEKYVPQADMSLTINTQKIADALLFFMPDVKGFDNTQLNFSLKNNDINVHVFIPSGGYKKNIFTNNYITLNTTGDTFHLTTRTSHYHFTASSTYIDSVQLSAWGVNNNIKYNFSASKDTAKYKTKIDGSMVIRDTTQLFKIANALLVFNGQRWKIDAGNALVLSKHNIIAENLNINNGKQTIVIETDSADAHQLNFVFKNVQAGDYYNIFNFGGVNAYGSVTGTLSVRNILSKPLVWADMGINNLQIDKDTIGKVSLKSAYDPETEKITLNGNIIGKDDDIKAEGFLYTADNKNDINININVVKADLRAPFNFLKDFFSSVKGSANGQLLLKGTISNPILTGDLLVPTGELTVNYLKTHYHFINEKVHFTKNAFELVENDILDVYNNRARLSGFINHKNFGNWGADLYMSTNKLQVLNTGEIDNSLFYGRAFASGTVRMVGPFDNMQMDISLRTQEGTVVSIPISPDQSLSGNDFVRFAKKDTIFDKEIDSSILAKTGIKINMDLDITPKAEVKMIFNKKSGDIIDGVGSGNLRMEINTAGDFKMYGTYNIDYGNYLFTLPELLTTKYFNIDRGGSITWSGDPYGATINLSAIYPRKVLMEGLVLGTPFESALTDADKTELSQRLPVSVYLKLNGSLFEPSIDFDIIVPPEIENMYGIVSRRLQEIKQDKSELNKQVFGLLVFNKFLPPSGSSSSTNSSSSNYTSGAIESTVGEFFADQLSYWLSQINSKTELNVNYYGGTTTPSSVDVSNYQALRQAQVELSQKLFNDKLKVVVGSNIDFGTANGNPNVNNNNSANFAGDFLLEYQLKDNFKLGAYRRTQYDYTSELNRIRSGGKLSYKLEFDKWGDWRKYKQLRKQVPAKTASTTAH